MYSKFPTVLFFVGIALTAGGCAAGGTRPAKPSGTVSAAGAVVGASTSQPVTEKDLQNMARQVAKDPSARSAVEAIAGSLSQPSVTVKYCPKDGKRYDARFENCPEHGVKLEVLKP